MRIKHLFYGSEFGSAGQKSPDPTGSGSSFLVYDIEFYTYLVSFVDGERVVVKGLLSDVAFLIGADVDEQLVSFVPDKAEHAG